MKNSGTISPNPENVKKVLRTWAKHNKLVRKIYIYGSWAKGEANHESDLDVALEIDKERNDQNTLATWFCEKTKWYSELQPLIPSKLHLEWNDTEGSTPHITFGIQECSILIYQRCTLTNFNKWGQT